LELVQSYPTGNFELGVRSLFFLNNQTGARSMIDEEKVAEGSCTNIQLVMMTNQFEI
jgi:hypothetical protein